MNRRSFLRRAALGIGATVSLAAVGFNDFLIGHGLRKRAAFPIWTAKYKRFGKSGWHAITKLNIPEGQDPPINRSWNGQPYDRFLFNPEKLTVSYVAR